MKTIKEIDFNMNEHVKVKLTERGREILKQRHKEIFKGRDIKYTPPVEDEDGWSEWQLWCLLEEFGRELCCGISGPFETGIKILMEVQG